MRILHVVSTYPPYRGGMGNVARALVERTAARGYDVRVVTPVEAHPVLRFGNAAWCPLLGWRLADADVVHFHWPFIGGLASVLRWRRACAERRLVVLYHMDLVARGWRGMVFRAYARVALPRLLACADRVVVTSRDYAAHGALAPFVATLGERLVEIPLGVNAERFHPTPLLRQSFAGQAPGPPSRWEGGKPTRLLFVGGLDRAHVFKGVPVLLDALAQVQGVRLSVVGDGDLREQFEARARALGIADRVAFLGALDDATLPATYADADVIVLPSTSRSEAFGLVLLEGMACGIATIASDLPGVRTVVRDGATGLLVPPGDAGALARAITWLRDHPDERRAFGAAGRALVEERYAWERIVDRWVDVYRNV